MGNLFPRIGKYVSESDLSSDTESDSSVDNNSADTRMIPSTSLNTADASLRRTNTCDATPGRNIISLFTFDQPQYALQEIALWRIEKDRQVLHEWASLLSGKGYIWKNQLLEALCIIRNYQILKALGYDKDQLIHFLPHSPYASVYVNKLRKMLYIICEKLDSSKTDMLLEYVKRDYMYKNMELNEFSMDPTALELYLLDWESSGYIKQTNVENLMKAFKVMEEDELYDMLDSYHKSLQKPPNKQVNVTSPKLENSKKAAKPQLGLSTEIPVVAGTSEECANNLFRALWDDRDEICHRVSTSVDNQQQHVRTDQSLRVYRGLGDPESLETNLFEPTVEEDNRFYIDPENPGVMLIINQEHFYTETMEKYRHLLPTSSEQLERRVGTENDKLRLTNTFEKFGFKVFTEDNLKHMDMLHYIKKTVACVKNESSLFVCILSHGDEVNDQKNQQEEYVESQSLTTDGATNLPHPVNLVTFWATVPGYAAIRHKEKGSWFIQSLCEKIEAYQDKRDVIDKRWIKGAAEFKMVSDLQTTFIKDFFLPKIRL
nr:unnamed protein product [Callosobruchus chinensis]